MTKNGLIEENQATAMLPRSVREVVIVHGVGLLIVLLENWFLIPVFAEDHEGIEHLLPGPTLFFLAISSWTNKHAIIAIFIACAFLAGDARFCAWLHQVAGKRASHVLYWCGLALVIAVIAFSLGTMIEVVHPIRRIMFLAVHTTGSALTPIR